MTFDEILAQVLDLLQREKRLSYRALKVRFGQARAPLSTAIDLYRAMDMTFWLPQAEATLAQVRALA